MEYFKKKKISSIMIFAFMIASIYICSDLMDVNWLQVFTNFHKSIVRFSENYLPMDTSRLLEQLQQLWITIIISLAGAFVGMILAFFSAIAISASTCSNTFVKYIVRGFASFTRNIPDAVWAVILIPCLWFGEFLGFIVMCIISYGFLTRAFADSIDEANSSCIEALKATGASYWQIIFHAVIPETMPSLISWSLFAAENNIRSATVIGMLTGGGIGFLMGTYKGFMKYQLLCTSIVLIVIVVIITDQISTQIRKRIL